MSDEQKAHNPELDEFISEFVDAKGRAAVLVGAAGIDNALENILRSVLRPAPAKQDDLLDGDSPLATFSARISLSQRLGIIDADLAGALHILRKVRNDFAHRISGCRFESPPHSDRIAALVNLIKDESLFKRFQEGFSASGAPPAEANCRAVMCYFYGRLLVVKRNASVIQLDTTSLK